MTRITIQDCHKPNQSQQSADGDCISQQHNQPHQWAPGQARKYRTDAFKILGILTPATEHAHDRLPTKDTARVYNQLETSD